MDASTSFKSRLISGTAMIALACLSPFAAAAQVTTDQSTPAAPTPTGAATPTEGAGLSSGNRATSRDADQGEVVITGSRIKQNPNNSALPLQIITTQEIERNGISSPEQLLSYLTDNGNSSDNLASNSDVVTAERRGNNGASFANLRGQGSAATLVLLNGRRVAAQGTTGAAVDVNQIPFMAIDRVEVLKDGASAIYGTDAVGGVINFITKKNYTGFGATASSDITEQGDSPIYRASAIAGYGDLDEQHFNVMATVGYSWVAPLQAHDRSFINTFQHDRGLGVDTRGTPFATIVSLAGTAFPASTSFPFLPGSTSQRATGGINLLRLPGQAGCGAIADQGIYDTDVWGAPGNALACAFDTGRNVYLQQRINTLTYLGRAVARFGAHEFTLELTGSKADSDKRFSQVQITPNTTTQNYQYKLVPGVNDAAYAGVYNTLIGAFPALRATIPYGTGFSYRWRCMECGERQIKTTTKTFRAAFNATGPIFADWDYSAGISYADSRSDSRLGGGYYFQDAMIAALNSGAVDPFLFPGQTQSIAGLAAIKAASAEGVVLYGGKYSVKQADASVSGSLFNLPAGTVKLAAGVDYRREEYHFDGDQRTVQRTIIAAPFDNGNALDGVHRDIKAVYGEMLVPILKSLELTLAGRIDDYTGFGTTKNPKVSLKFRPWNPIMFRASYNTAFRVPSFNQIFNPDTSSLYTGADFADPKNCPGGKVNEAAGCPSLSRSIDIINGGRRDLGPETAKEFSAGVVFEPSRHFSASVDWWKIDRRNTIQVLPLQYFFQNYDSFQDRFIRDGSGKLVAVDQTYANVGKTRTDAIDVTARGAIDALGGTVSAGIDGTYLLKKTEKLNASSATIQELGVYSLANDLGLRWKHNAYVAYTTPRWSITFTQIFRDGYKNQVLPGILAGTFDPCCDVTRVKNYVIYNLSASYSGIEHMRFVAGIKNLFDKDPPFAISYDSNNGTGSNWEPRVADPRGRSFNLSVEVKF
jgi:iron complex outermembrane receptor protein